MISALVLLRVEEQVFEMKHSFIILFSLIVVQLMAQQRVGVGTLTPDPSAQLELAATNKGVLIPRMTSAQRQMTPNATNGLLVFDVTTVGFWYFDGVQWVQPLGIIGAQGAVGITGIDGIQGQQGPTGPQSVIVGAQGVVGITGPQGVQGPVGAQGIPGILGATGIIGNTGPQGIVGTTGGIGPQGPVGNPGATGPSGPPSFNTAIAFSPNGIMSVTDASSTLNTTISAWMTLGNANTNSVNNFVGTTDNQDLNISTASTERMRVLGNGNIWLDGSKPFMLRRFCCNNCDNPNRNTGVAANDYIAILWGSTQRDDGDNRSTRARCYVSGGTWWFKGNLESVDDEDWSVDILFMKLEMADDQRPASGNGGGTAF